MSRGWGGAVVLATLLWISLASWAMLSPVGAAPDDDYHLAMIYCAAGEAECQPEGGREGPCFAMQPTVSAECSDWHTRTLPRTEGINAEHYPPFYYAVMAPWTGADLADTTRTVRLLNVTLSVAMLMVAMALTAPALRRGLVISWVVAAVPMAVYFVSSLNPSAWVIIGIATLWAPLLTFLTAPGGAGAIWICRHDGAHQFARAGFVVFAAFIALAGRTEGALFLPLIVVAMLAFALPSKRGALTSAQSLRLALPLALVLLAGLFMWLFARPKAETLGAPDGVEPTYAGWEVLQHAINSFLGTLGMPGVPGSGLGTYDVPVPAVAAILVAFAYGAVTLFGLGLMYGRKALALTIFASAAFTLVAVLWSQESWEYFQPRYYVPLSFVWLGLLLLPRPQGWPVALGASMGYSPSIVSPQDASRTVNLSPGLLGTLLAAIALANCTAMLSTALRFTRGLVPQPTRDPLTPLAPQLSPNELLAVGEPRWWWEGVPGSPFALWLIGSIAFAATLTVVWTRFRWPSEVE